MKVEETTAVPQPPLTRARAIQVLQVMELSRGRTLKHLEAAAAPGGGHCVERNKPSMAGSSETWRTGCVERVPKKGAG